MANPTTPSAKASKPLYKSLYFQVIAAIVIGVLLGHYFPDTGTAMKPLGDGFIKLIKMIIAPIIFCTIVIGIAGMEDMKKVGKVGGYAVLYFEIVSTIALLVGLVIVNVLQPGAGMNVDPATLDTLQQLADREVLGPHTVERRQATAEHVIAAGEQLGPIERPEVGDVLDHAELARIATRVGADRARVLGVDVAARPALDQRAAHCGQRIEQLHQCGLAALDQP